MTIPRLANELLLKRSRQYSVVTVLGPRQSGKTTLCRAAFPAMAYVNLERPDHRDFARSDPQAFLAMYTSGVILDEIQNVPELLSWIQVLVDADVQKRKGLFILTGSHQLLLNQHITQSLAGRTAVIQLLPLSMQELMDHSTQESHRDANWWMLQGGYPKIHGEGLPADVMLADYFATYVERDARQLLELRNTREFNQCIRLLAGRVGQLQNMTSIANDLGVSSRTIANWISVLEASYLVFNLSPWHANLGKRLTKAPKLYFYDVGLACWLLGIRTTDQLAMHPLRGALFENLIVVEMLKTLRHKGRLDPLHFYRDSNDVEIDVVHETATGLHLIEVKASQTLSGHQFKGLQRVAQLLQESQFSVESQALVYGGTESQERSSVSVKPFWQTYQLASLGTNEST